MKHDYRFIRQKNSDIVPEPIHTYES